MATQNILPTDNLVNNLGLFGNNLSNANNIFPDFVLHLNGLVNSVRGVNSSLTQNNAGLLNGLTNISNSLSSTTRSIVNSSRSGGIPRMPDLGNLFGTGFQHPVFTSNLRNTISNGMTYSLEQSFKQVAPKSIARSRDMLNPVSFAQDAMIFGATFPAQMKMAQAVTKPVTDVAETFGEVKKFTQGFTGIGYALDNFKAQLKNPFEMYENMYQSRIMLSSALGGEKAGSTAMNTALNLAKQYPITAPESLSMLTRLAVYPRVKQNLQSEGFQKKLMETVSGLSMIVPEQGLGGAMFSMVEAMSGIQRSMQMRFNVSPELIQSLSGMSKSEMSSDPTKLVEGMHRFISKAVGLDVLEKQKYSFSKQVGLFGDVLHVAVKNIFETTGLYKSVSGGATAVRAGFSALSDNKEFMQYMGGMFQPYQNKLDQAIASFTGVGVGTYRTMPIAQVVEAMEKNFKDMSFDEIGTRFEGLINDIGDIWQDTSIKVDSILSSKFGDVLGDLGGNIAQVASKSFSNMASGVIKGFGSAVLNNPMDVIKPALALAVPTMGALAAARMVPSLLIRGFEGGTFKNMGVKAGEMLQGARTTATSGLRGTGSNAAILGGALEEGMTISRSNVGDLFNTQKLKLDEMIAGNITKTNTKVTSMASELMSERNISGNMSNLRFSNRSLSSYARNMPAEEKALYEGYVNKLKSAGFSEGEISKITESVKLQNLKSLESQSFVSTGNTRLSMEDARGLRRSIYGTSYNYGMTEETLKGIQYTGAKSVYGDTFKAGDRITSNIVKSFEAPMKDYKQIIGMTKGSELSGITSQSALNRFAKDLNIDVSDIVSGNVTNEQLKTLQENGKQLRQSSESSKELLDGFRNNRFKGVSNLETDVKTLFPGIGENIELGTARNMAEQLGKYDYNSLIGTKTADRMTRLLNRNKVGLEGMEMMLNPESRSVLGTNRLNILDTLNTKQYEAFRRGGMGNFLGATLNEQRGVVAGNEVLSSIVTDKNLYKDVMDSMSVGRTQFAALRNMEKLSSFVRNSKTFQGLKTVGGGALSLLDPLMLGYQGYSIANTLGYSKGNAGMIGGLAGAGAGAGLFGLKYMMGGAAFKASLGSALGIGGGLTALYTGLEALQYKLESDKEIQGQLNKFKGTVSGLNIEGLDKGLLLSAGGGILNNESVRQQAGMKSMMSNALLKTLLIGGGAAAALFSGGTLLPMLGLAAASQGVLQGARDYYKGKNAMPEEASSLMGITRGFVGGSEYYNKKIEENKGDISSLEYKKLAGGGLTLEETSRLSALKKLTLSAEENKNTQLQSLNTVSGIYNTSPGDVENNVTANRLLNYLDKNKNNASISSFLGSAAVSSEAFSKMNTDIQNKIQQGKLSSNDQEEINKSVKVASNVAKEMQSKFFKTVANVNIENADQVKTITDAQVGMIESMKAPLGNEKAMDAYVLENKGNLIKGKVYSQIRSTLARNRSEKDMYSILEMAYGTKLGEIGVSEPLSSFSGSEQDFYKREGLKSNYNVSDFYGKYYGRMQSLGINNEMDMVRNIGKVRLSGLFNVDERKDIENIRTNFGNSLLATNRYKLSQIDTFKGIIGAITDNSELDIAKKEQKNYENLDLSGLSTNKQKELQYAIARRGQAFNDMTLSGLEPIAQRMYGKNATLQNLSNDQILGLLNNPDVKTMGIGENFANAEKEFNASSFVLSNALNKTADSVEKTFATSIEKANGAVKLFSEGLITSNEFTNKTSDIFKEISNTTGLIELGAKNKQKLSQGSFDELIADQQIKSALSKAGISDVSQLGEIDKSGVTGLNRLIGAEGISGSTYDKLASINTQYQEGSEELLGARKLKFEAANQMSAAAYSLSATGDQNFGAVAKTLLAGDYKGQLRLRESSSKELSTLMRAYEQAAPEQKAGLESAIMSNIQEQQGLGLNPFQIRRGVGGELYDKVSGGITDRIVNKTNNEQFMNMLGVKPEESSYMIKTATGVFSGTTPTEDQGRISLGNQPLVYNPDNDVTRDVKGALKMASDTITAASVDSGVSKTLSKPQSVSTEGQNINAGDKVADVHANTSNISALEGLQNKSPSINPSLKDDSFSYNL